MADAAALEAEFTRAQEEVVKQGDVVRALKAELKDGRADKVGLGAPSRLQAAAGRLGQRPLTCRRRHHPCRRARWRPRLSS